MCRWIAYIGEPIFLEDVLVKPSHSLLRQSRFAEENIIKGNPVIPDGPFPSNDDGFGIAWYGGRPFPGLYKELRPAWNDRNYLTIAAQTKSRLFLAHLRAAYQGLVQRSNCHPFRYQNWLFQHNGEINGFDQIKRDIAIQIDPALFPLIEGTTDTEWFFYLAISCGLLDSPQKGFEKAIAVVEKLKISHGIEKSFKLTASVSDGENIYAIRYATTGNAKSLYINNSEKALTDDDSHVILPLAAKLLVSEPLSDMRQYWDEIPEESFITVSSDGCTEIVPLRIVV